MVLNFVTIVKDAMECFSVGFERILTDYIINQTEFK